MKLKLAIFALVCAVGSLTVLAQDPATAAQKEAKSYAQALMANDYAQVLAYTHERVVTRMGEKEAALGLMKKSGEEMKAKGLSVVDARIGTPEPARKIGAWTICVVPAALTFRTPTTKAHQDSHLLGISADEGKTWKFIDLGPLSEEMFFVLFPELKGQFKLPKKEQAVLEQNP
jgi:hypothetical protein